MSHDVHLEFIVAAYALAFVIIAGMAVTIMADYRSLTKALSSFATATRERRQDTGRRESNRAPRTSRGPDEEGLA